MSSSDNVARARGDGGLHWDKTPEALGRDGNKRLRRPGKRQVRACIAEQKAEAVARLREFNKRLRP